MSLGMQILVLGARSQIGVFLLPMLIDAGFKVSAVTRSRQQINPLNQTNTPTSHSGGSIAWLECDLGRDAESLLHIDCQTMISLAPLSATRSAILTLARAGLKRVIAFSTTSRFSKRGSADAKERKLAEEYTRLEREIAALCSANGIHLTLLRPTLIYGCGMDRNITLIANFIQRFHFFPVLAPAKGLRQPVHAQDLAKACVDILHHPPAYGKAYNLSGGETLSYRQMVERIFRKMGKPARIVPLPLWLFRLAMMGLGRFEKFRSLSPAMAARMNADLAFEHSEASRDFAYAPREFDPVWAHPTRPFAV